MANDEGLTLGGAITYPGAAMKTAIKKRQESLPASDEGPDYGALEKKRRAAEDAKAKYMKENGVDENGNPAPKPSSSPSP